MTSLEIKIKFGNKNNVNSIKIDQKKCVHTALDAA